MEMSFGVCGTSLHGLFILYAPNEITVLLLSHHLSTITNHQVLILIILIADINSNKDLFAIISSLAEEKFWVL